jgi:hypothetical protein
MAEEVDSWDSTTACILLIYPPQGKQHFKQKYNGEVQAKKERPYHVLLWSTVAGDSQYNKYFKNNIDYTASTNLIREIPSNNIVTVLDCLARVLFKMGFMWTKYSSSINSSLSKLGQYPSE